MIKYKINKRRNNNHDGSNGNEQRIFFFPVPKLMHLLLISSYSSYFGVSAAVLL